MNLLLLAVGFALGVAFCVLLKVIPTPKDVQEACEPNPVYVDPHRVRVIGNNGQGDVLELAVNLRDKGGRFTKRAPKA